MTPAVSIGGYAPGALGWVAAEHGRYYAREWQLPAAFECRVAAELAAIVAKFDPRRDGFWIAHAGETLAGSITVDGSSEPQWARLRFFILSDAHRGRGIGNALMNTAMDFCRQAGHRRIYLLTFAGLAAARHLYEKFGFRQVAEHLDASWGRPLLELRYEQRLH